MSTPTPDHEPSGLDVELTAALEDFGRQARPHEFDAHAILRRTARRRSIRTLTASAAGLAVIAGATAFAAQAKIGAAPNVTPAATATGSSTATDADPLVVPGTFDTVPDGGTVSSFTELGVTTDAAVIRGSGDPGATDEQVETEWTAHGVDMVAEVSWFQDSAYTPSTHETGFTRTEVGTVNGQPAYVMDMPQRLLTFWTGSRGWATATIFANGVTEQSASVADLLSVARSLRPTPAAVPMPIRVTGLTGAQISSADMGWVGGPHPDAFPWGLDLRLTYDGRSYDITAVPGTAATPSPTGTETTTGLVTAAESIDGVGISVSTSSSKQGSPDAPTAAQILAHVTSLGASPTGWTTDVIAR